MQSPSVALPLVALLLWADSLLYCTSLLYRPAMLKTSQILAPTKISRQQNVGADAEGCPSAESTAADFSQTSLKISFVSQMVLIPLHAVDKCGIASGRPAFMGRLSHLFSCRKCHKFWRDKISSFFT